VPRPGLGLICASVGLTEVAAGFEIAASSVALLSFALEKKPESRAPAVHRS
jgi:hypothetical protein